MHTKTERVTFTNLLVREKSNVVGSTDSFKNVEADMPSFSNGNAKGDLRKVSSLEDIGNIAQKSAESLKKAFEE